MDSQTTSPATSNDDYTPVPATISLNLPRELVERILLLLDTKPILKCRLVNREFNAIIQSSTLIQYCLACKAAGVIDNPQSPLSYAERLEVLKKREDAWKKLKPAFETTIKVNDQSWGLYELTAGKYFRRDIDEKDLYYCQLPSSPHDNPQWFRIPGYGPGQSRSGSIIDMGMAVYEHDLVINVISSEIGDQTDMRRHSLDLVLIKLSTGEYHPLAHHPLIHVQRSLSSRPDAAVRTVGSNLALVVHDEEGSKLFIFDWKTGHKRLQHKATEGAYKYSGPFFVSPELLLVPNRILFQFEVWHLPSHPNLNPPVQILSLQIPAVSRNYSNRFGSIYCHGEPSPFLHSMPYFPPRPFFASPESSIIIVNLEFLEIRKYKLIMHRHALLDMIQKWTSPSVLEQDSPTWLTNEATVHEVVDPADGSITRGAQSELVSTMPHTGSSPRIRGSSTFASPTLPTSNISTNSGSSSLSCGASFVPSTARYNFLQVKWANWGPPISRWWLLSERQWQLTATSVGQRYAFRVPNPDDKKFKVGVADFNPHNVRRNAETMAQLRGEGENNGAGGNIGEGKNDEELEILDHGGVFSEEVYMGLKCVVYHAPGEYDFDAVLMDEERLLGMKNHIGDNKMEIQVLYLA